MTQRDDACLADALKACLEDNSYEAMGEVLEFLFDKGILVHLGKGGRGKNMFYCEIWIGETLYEELHADTLPEAVAKAAIQALSEEA